jgi:hypothetical protein
VTATAVFLAILFAAGSGLPQSPPKGEDAPAAPFLRQGTIQEEELPIPQRRPPPQSAPTVPPENPQVRPRPAPATVETPAPTDLRAVRAAFEKPDGSYELPPLGPADGAVLPQRNASMKLLQQGRALLQGVTYKAALARFEQAVGIDATNPYSHYFIARAHYFLENYRDSVNFLDVAVARAPDARWLAEVHVLRALNAAAIGFHGRADVHYIRALTVNPDHAFALARLTTIDTVKDARPKQ